MNRLAGKVAVITGGGSGIGRAAARMFVAEGAKVVVAEIDAALGEASAREAGTDARFVKTDVTDEESVKQMVQQAKAAFGHVDVLLNCAGGSLREDSPVTEVDPSVWDHTINLDMKGPFLCCRHVIPGMVERGKGSVVNFSSVVALRGNHIAMSMSWPRAGLSPSPRPWPAPIRPRASASTPSAPAWC
jgi:NAD(P)-dependent dehydrogenase (short-subunit alcohol dehydrogenase family)